MFRNESHGIVIPQQEHARLAGFLAMMWGNDKFELPPINPQSLILGIANHHQGYGSLDAIDFKKVSADEIVSILRKDCEGTTGDNDADLVNLYHQMRLADRRLAKGSDSGLLDFRNWINELIGQKLQNSVYKAEDFLWSDRITDICDRLAFLFCSGSIHEEDIPVYQARGKHSAVTVKITVGDAVRVQPWPFKLSPLYRDIVGYQESSYPDQLIPAILEFSAQ